MEGGEVVGLVMGISVFTLIGWIVFVVVDGRRRRERLKVFTEFHSRLLDRIGSAKEFGDFLQTDGGVRFLNTLSVERGTAPGERILRSVHVGVVLLTLGIGLLSLGTVFRHGEVGFTITGVIALSLGVGFLLSSGVTFRLSKMLGLVDDWPPTQPTQQR